MSDIEPIIAAMRIRDQAMQDMETVEETDPETEEQGNFWIACVWFGVAFEYCGEDDLWEANEALDQVVIYLDKCDPARQNEQSQIIQAGVGKLRLISG